MIEISKGENNTFKFKLKTTEGNTLFSSIDFGSEEDIQRTLENLHPLMDRQSVFERRTDHNGKFLFNLKDQNGNLIGKSLHYGSEAGMENGIKNLKNRIANISGGTKLH